MRTPIRLLAVAAVVPACLSARATLAAQPQSPRTVTEALVQARAEDGILNSGAMFSPANGSAKPIAVIWVHGNGVNFYSPTYLTIARELAMRGLTTITVNTRMHDLGNVAGYHGETRIRGGSYWGATSEQVRDLAGWIDFAKQRGFNRVVLVGHSAGATAVQLYGAQRQDDRVAGIVLASGRFRPGTAPVDSARLKEAARLVAEGRGEEVPQIPNAARPTVTSAATLLDLANMGVMLVGMLMQPLVGFVLDRHWRGALSGGARVYDFEGYRAAFSLMLAWTAAALVLLAFTRETGCRQAR